MNNELANNIADILAIANMFINSVNSEMANNIAKVLANNATNEIANNTADTFY